MAIFLCIGDAVVVVIEIDQIVYAVSVGVFGATEDGIVTVCAHQNPAGIDEGPVVEQFVVSKISGIHKGIQRWLRIPRHSAATDRPAYGTVVVVKGDFHHTTIVQFTAEGDAAEVVLDVAERDVNFPTPNVEGIADIVQSHIERHAQAIQAIPGKRIVAFFYRTGDRKVDRVVERTVVVGIEAEQNVTRQVTAEGN